MKRDNLTRSEKINTIKGIMAGKISVAEVAEPETFIWVKPAREGYKPFLGKDAEEMSEEQFKTYIDSRQGRNEKHIVLKETVGCVPIIDKE